MRATAQVSAALYEGTDEGQPRPKKIWLARARKPKSCEARRFAAVDSILAKKRRARSPRSMGEISASSVQNHFRMLLNAPYTERLIQTCNQYLIAKRFGKKADRAGRKCLCPCFHFRKSGNENDREVMTLANQFALQLYPIHTRHLHVANQAIGVIQPVRFQERFSGCKLKHRIPKSRMKLMVAWRNGSLSSTIAITAIIVTP